MDDLQAPDSASYPCRVLYIGGGPMLSTAADVVFGPEVAGAVAARYLYSLTAVSPAIAMGGSLELLRHALSSWLLLVLDLGPFPTAQRPRYPQVQVLK